jgi:hypothetical protein
MHYIVQEKGESIFRSLWDLVVLKAQKGWHTKGLEMFTMSDITDCKQKERNRDRKCFYVFFKRYCVNIRT